MAVYVDDMNLSADVPNGTTIVRGKWSHLFADTEGELRAFARKIGLKQDWIQHPGEPHAHFDVVGRMRQRAIAAGAQPVTWRQAGEFFAERTRHALTPVHKPVTSLLLVCGPREGVSKDTVRAALAPKFAATIMLVAGGAKGVDTHAAQLWREWGGLVEEHPVTAHQWDRNPRGAGYARNAVMVERVKTAGGSALVFDLPCTTPGCPRPQPHNTHGTSHCAEIAADAGLPVDHYQAPTAGRGGPQALREPRASAVGGRGPDGDHGAARGRALRQAAHLYLGHGLLPVPGWAAKANGACCCPRGVACPRPGKHPRSVHVGPGERDYSWKPLACSTHEEVEQRFADGGEYAGGNLMLAIPAGMLVVDQDDDDGGPQAIATLARQLGELPATLAHRTPHGVHRIYRTPPGWTGRAWVGKDTRNPLPAGIDLRVPGQILMAPPSQVPGPNELATYGPAEAAVVADLPAAYLAAWTPPQRPAARRPVPVPPSETDRATKYVHAKVEGITADLAAREPGGRNAAIYTAALKVGSTLGAASTTPGAEYAAAAWTGQAAEDALMEAAEANGYVAKHGHAAARSAIRSGLRNGLRSPQPLPDFTTPPAPTRERSQQQAPPMAPDHAADRPGTSTATQDRPANGHRSAAMPEPGHPRGLPQQGEQPHRGQPTARGADGHVPEMSPATGQRAVSPAVATHRPKPGREEEQGAGNASPASSAGSARQASRRQAPTVRSVSSVLRYAGFVASSQARKVVHVAEGYQVQAMPDGSILIRHLAISEPVNGISPAARNQRMLAEYEAALVAAGFYITRQASPGTLTVIPEPPRQRTAESPAPGTRGNDKQTQADQAAAAADKAYRAGDFDRARRFIGQAAEMDPDRADVWQRHQAEITAKQLFAQAKQAAAEGDEQRASGLLSQARDLDPRMAMLWDRHLTGVRGTHPARQAGTPAAAPSPGRDRSPAARQAGTGQQTVPQVPGGLTLAHTEPQPAATTPAAAPRSRNTEPHQRTRHSWEPAAEGTKRCTREGCGMVARQRPHPTERRWLTSYTKDGRTIIAERVPACGEPFPQARSSEEMRRLASEADRQAGHAFRAGDIDRAYRLLTDARALDPQQQQLWDQHERQIRASVADHQPRQTSHSGEKAECGQCGHSYIRPVGETYPCLSCQTQARLKAAGFTPSSPEIQKVTEWNRDAIPAPDRPPEKPQPQPEPERQPENTAVSGHTGRVNQPEPEPEKEASG